MENDIDFSDDSTPTSGDALSIKEIILRQIRKIGDLSCKEFTEGYWEKKPMKTGSGIIFTKKYHEDVREAYCNAVDFLIDVVYPMGDKDLKEYLKNFEGFEEKIDQDSNKSNKDDDADTKLAILKKLKLKRQTFRQINIMFESNNFWKGSIGYSE